VPVTAGKVDFHNGGTGSVHAVADLDGFFGTDASGATQSYVPFGPTRVADTRSPTQGQWFGSTKAHGVVSVYGNFIDPGVIPDSFVFNVTVTGPAAT
jgi:hypothetical protein